VGDGGGGVVGAAGCEGGSGHGVWLVMVDESGDIQVIGDLEVWSHGVIEC
jgi:hypothetical protein